LEAEYCQRWKIDHQRKRWIRYKSPCLIERQVFIGAKSLKTQKTECQDLIRFIENQRKISLAVKSWKEVYKWLQDHKGSIVVGNQFEK